jgi:hypothetical protein
MRRFSRGFGFAFALAVLALAAAARPLAAQCPTGVIPNFENVLSLVVAGESITLEWDPHPGAPPNSTYEILRSTAESYCAVYETPPTVFTTTTDTRYVAQLDPVNTVFRYAVRLKDCPDVTGGIDYHADSFLVKPGKPSPLKAHQSGEGEVTLIYQNVDDTVSQLDFYRRTNEGPQEHIGTSAGHSFLFCPQYHHYFIDYGNTGNPTTGGTLQPATYTYEVAALNFGFQNHAQTFGDPASATITGQEPPCTTDENTLCLNGGRFKVDVDWAVPSQGRSGVASAVPLTGDTGFFWFFNPANVELVIKVLDGRPVNGHFWVFYGALSTAQYHITVTDTATGEVQTYDNPSGNLASHADNTAFPTAGTMLEAKAASAHEIRRRSAEELYGLYAALTQARPALDASAAPACAAGSGTLCLNQKRFQVSVDWSVPAQDRSGTGTAIPITSDTGYFWFFNPANVELIIKVLDGRPVNGHYWVFYGALSNVQYRITVTDTTTGAIQTYDNPSGTLGSESDTDAF